MWGDGELMKERWANDMSGEDDGGEHDERTYDDEGTVDDGR